MPEKLQNLSDKILHIRSNSAEPDKQLSVKYLSEIITARTEEIMLAILYEIEKSGYADKLRNGIVVTGGSAKLTNLGSFIYDLSGFKTRIGYPKMIFSGQGCDGLLEPSAAVSLGLILSSKNDYTTNCTIVEERKVEEEIEVDVTIIDETGEAEKAPEGCLFPESQIEKVETAAKPRKRQKEGAGIKVVIEKFKDKVGDLFTGFYEFVNEGETE